MGMSFDWALYPSPSPWGIATGSSADLAAAADLSAVGSAAVAGAGTSAAAIGVFQQLAQQLLLLSWCRLDVKQLISLWKLTFSQRIRPASQH